MPFFVSLFVFYFFSCVCGHKSNNIWFHFLSFLRILVILLPIPQPPFSGHHIICNVYIWQNFKKIINRDNLFDEFCLIKKCWRKVHWIEEENSWRCLHILIWKKLNWEYHPFSIICFEHFSVPAGIVFSQLKKERRVHWSYQAF